MPGLIENIDRINEKLQRFLRKYNQLQKDNERQSKLISELQALKQNNAQTIATLQEQVAILKSSMGKMNEQEKKAFEKHINHYIKEIDKCIGVLSQ